MKRLGPILALAALGLLAACASRPSVSDLATRSDAQAYGDFMVARYAAMTNDPSAASRYYAQAMSSAPSEMAVPERAVFSALLANDYGLAAGLSRRASNAGSTAGLVRLTQIVDLIGRGKNTQALETISGSGFSGFNQMLGHNLSAWARVGLKDYEGARAELAGNLTGEPRLDSATLHMKGFIEMSAGDDEAALATFTALWNSGARLAVGAEAYAQLLAASGKRAEAADVLDRFRTEAGFNAALEALKADIESGKEIQPKRYTARQGAALVLHLPAAALIGQTSGDVSAVYFVLAIALDPDLYSARTLLGQALIQGGRNDEAIRVLKGVPASSPYYASARGQLARLLLDADRPDEALRLAGEAIAAKPERGLKIQLATLYSSLDRYSEAEEILTGIIADDTAEDREDWQVLFLRGAARERLKEWDGAETDLSRALELNPGNANVLNYLGYSWIDRGVRMEEGFSLIQQAVALEPFSGHIIDSLGWAHYRLGRYDEAVEWLERAVELLPADPVLNDHLGDAYWKVGRHTEAGFQWRRALKLDPSAEDKAKIEEKLRGGIQVDPPSPGAEIAP